MKRWICLLLTLCLLAALCPAALAVEDVAAEAAEAAVPMEAAALAKLGVFRGTGTGFALDRAPTRLEAAAMLVRLNGAEAEALEQFAAEETNNPFADVAGWGEPYVAWLASGGMARGVSETAFGAQKPCRAKDYAVFLLRALGYADGEDFTYADAEAFAAQLGFYQVALFGGTFTRGDLAWMTWFALFAKTKGGSQTLLQRLVAEQAVDAETARQLQQQYQSAGVTLSADGPLVHAGLWQSALRELTVTVAIESDFPSFPSGEEVLEGEALAALAQADGQGRVRISAEAVQALVSGWEETYCACSVPFQFDSYVKGMTGIDFLKCDYRFDREELVKALLRQLMTRQSGTIDAPLVCLRGGKPFSLGDTYVEVDFDNQQLTFFKNGKLIVNTNVVTGKLDGHQTPTGLYYAHNKLTNTTLTGDDYEVFVKYWVSVVYDVIGLHDASWRSAFGGDYYVYGGSHGCVNIPDAAMYQIFSNINDGTPVLMYGRNQWYEPGSADSPATKHPVRGQTAGR